MIITTESYAGRWKIWRNAYTKKEPWKYNQNFQSPCKKAKYLLYTLLD